MKSISAEKSPFKYVDSVKYELLTSLAELYFGRRKENKLNFWTYKNEG